MFYDREERTLRAESRAPVAALVVGRTGKFANVEEDDDDEMQTRTRMVEQMNGQPIKVELAGKWATNEATGWELVRANFALVGWA